mgnify:FL=1
MEDVKWLFRKCGFPILIFLFVVIVGTVCWEKLKTEKPQNVAEEVWEPPVEIENSEEVSVEEADTESSMESVYWFVPQSEECLITDEEKKELQSMVLSAAESVSEIYVDIVISDAPNYSSGISDFTGEQRKVVVEHLGSKGLVSVEEDTYMQNSELIENFYSDYLNGQDSMITVFEVEKDGLIGAVTFIYRKGKLQNYYIGVRWKQGGVPEIQGTSVSDVAEIKLTEKGYFIYAYKEVMAHASLRQYWRIKPLSERCRELTEKYISGLSYVNYNMLVVNWDNDGNIIEPTLLYNPNYNPNIWMPEVIQKESIHTVLETMKKVISEPTATGYGLHREEYTLAGKTGTAEIKLSKEDATGTELGWMAVFTTDPNIENPILLISMVEDVKNIGGSGYVVQKDKRVLDQYLR